MQYLLLIYANEAEVASLKKEELGALHQDYLAFTKSMAKYGSIEIRPTWGAG